MNNNQNSLTPAEQADHDRSVHDYPDLNLGDQEYVVIDVERSFCGILAIWLGALLTFGVFIALAFIIYSLPNIPNREYFALGLLAFSAAFSFVFALVATKVYTGNTFIVTNERVFARIQTTPFSVRSQNVELEHIEDCSFAQNSPLQVIFNYGSIRLSTVGDEQTYTFNFVANPKEQFKVVNKVVQQVDGEHTTRYHG